MIEVLCARTAAVLYSPELKRTVDFYQSQWGFNVVQHIPGVLAILMRESITVQLWQRRSDMPRQTFAYRLLVNNLELWLINLVSAAGQISHCMTEQAWGCEFGLSDCDGNRLLLVQSAPHAVLKRLRA